MTRHDVYQTKPATGLGNRWRDCTPLGNGQTGIALYGGIAAEQLIISRTDLWHLGRETSVPNVSPVLQKMRMLQREGNMEEACNMMYDALSDAGYQNDTATMRTLACAKFSFVCDGIYNHYRRILHMDTGEAQIQYCLGEKCYERCCFVSRKRDVIVMRVCSENASGFSVTQGFYDSYEGGREQYLREQDSKHAKRRNVGGSIVYSSANEGKYFGVVSKVVSDGDVTVTDEKIMVSRATNSLIIMKAFSEESEREKAEDIAINTVNQCPENYELLFEEHKELHSKLYHKADMKLYFGRKFHSNEELLADAREKECSNELLEKLWHFGRYLFISGIEKKGQPFPLYGLWPCGYERDWSQHVGNENVEMIHWHAAVGGLSELIEPLVHFYCDRLDGFRENAKNLFGCSGIFVSTYLSPKNSLISPHVPVILHFLGVAGWISRHLYEYYLFTRDEKLFDEKILPFMLEAAQFYEDYIYEDENGLIELYPAVSPENSPREYLNVKRGTASGHPMPVTKNPTIEFAILKELLTNLIEVSKTHMEIQNKVAGWKAMLSKIPPYQINEDGAIAEWMDKNVHDNYAHRHLSHVYPIFPGTEIEDSERFELLPAFKKAVDMRELGFMTGWSMAHMAAIYARLKEGTKVFESLNMLTKVCLLENFFTLHNDYRDMGITTQEMGDETFAPIQLDALMGIVNAVQEMLIFVSPKKIKLLPACPINIPKGSAKLYFFDGTIKMQWDMEKQSCKAEFTAIRDTEFMLELPFGRGERRVALAKGKTFREWCEKED